MNQDGVKKLKELLGKARETLRDYEVKRVETGVVRAFAVIGFIAVLAAGTFGAVTAVRFAPNALSSLGAAAVSLTSLFIPAERLAFSLEKRDVASEEELLVSWTHENPEGEGSYALTYGCVDGVSIFSPSAEGTMTLAFCDTPFNFLSATSSIRIAVTSDIQEIASVPLTLSFTQVGGEKPTAVATAEIVVRNDKVQTTEDGSAVSTTGVPGTSSATPRAAGERRSSVHVVGGSVSTQPTGTGVDLAARILETGIIDTTTNTFTATTSAHFSITVRPAVRFIVENLGTAASGSWNFSAVLPTAPAHTFVSDAQKSLGPNDRVEFTLGFDSFSPNESGVGTFTVNADPQGSLKEVSKENNIAKADIRATK